MYETRKFEAIEISLRRFPRSLSGVFSTCMMCLHGIASSALGATITADFIYTCVPFRWKKVDQARAVYNFPDLSTARSLAVCRYRRFTRFSPHFLLSIFIAWCYAGTARALNKLFRKPLWPRSGNLGFGLSSVSGSLSLFSFKDRLEKIPCSRYRIALIVTLFLLRP